MDLFEALDTRASAMKLTGPGPDPAQLDRILSAGVRAGDHGRLSPWRFRVLDGDDRAVLGEAMVEAMRAKRPDATGDDLQRERAKVNRAPTIVVVSAAVVRDHPKIPAWEQVTTAALGAHNMMLAAHALGLGSMWKTGGPTKAPQVLQALGLEPGEAIVGFIYLGTIAAPGEPRRLDAREFVRPLPGR